MTVLAGGDVIVASARTISTPTSVIQENYFRVAVARFHADGAPL